MRTLRYIDLFAGAGGLSEGFIREGFTPVAHVEMDASACDTLKTRLAFHYLKKQNKSNVYFSYLKGEITREGFWDNLPAELRETVINKEISEGTIQDIFTSIDRLNKGKSIDLIIGGPPCQAYSLVGRSRDPHRMQKDQRNYLFRYYAKFLKRYQPRYFVFENVLGLLTAGNKKYLNEMRALFKTQGYETAVQVLNAEDYGVLQRRRRVIIIGRKGKEAFSFPALAKTENTWQIKNDLFYDLPPLTQGQEMTVAAYTKKRNAYLEQSGIRNGEDFVTQHITRPHNERDLKIYSIAVEKWRVGERLQYPDLPEELKTHNNRTSFLDRFKVVNPEGHSHTVVAHIAKDGHYYIYPDKEQLRSISVREAARIQSFPDDYYFEGGRTAAFRQIGNAVPPLMARALARAIKGII